MIFLTVGTQLPFDRLVTMVDSWAQTQQTKKVIAQIGNSSLRPKNIECSAYMTAKECKACFLDSEIIVSHAGMGTILTALDLGKRLVIVPRLASMGEHRNDHQLATAEQFKHFPLVQVVLDLSQLGNVLDEAQESPTSMPPISTASSTLLQAVTSFITIDSGAKWPQT